MTDIDPRMHEFGLDGLDYFESHEAAKSVGIADPAKVAGPDGRVRRMLPGTEPGFITLISGESGGGKSSLAQVLTMALMRKGRRVLYCAWGPPAGQVLESLATTALGWSRTLTLGGLLTEEQISVLGQTCEEISQQVRFVGQGPFHGSSARNRTNERNLDVLASFVDKSGCDVVVADPWRYCLVSQKPDDEAEALRRQQAMCEDQNFHLFLLHAHDKEVSSLNDAYLDIADNHLVTHIPGVRARDHLELLILKQRHGIWPMGVDFTWDGDVGRIEGGTTIPCGLRGMI